jgi:hypothetical protein
LQPAFVLDDSFWGHTNGSCFTNTEAQKMLADLKIQEGYRDVADEDAPSFVFMS